MCPPKQQSSIISEAKERFKKFLLPEETMSLKLVFDNIRNYFMCAAVIVAVAAMSEQNAGRDNEIWPWTLSVFAFFLLGANALQSWLIINHVTRRVGRFQREVRPTWAKWKRRLARILLLALMLPFMIAAYDVIPRLILWAITGGSKANGL